MSTTLKDVPSAWRAPDPDHILNIKKWVGAQDHRESESGIRFYRNLHFFNAGVNVEDCIVTWTDDGFVFNDDNLQRKEFRWSGQHFITVNINNCLVASSLRFIADHVNSCCARCLDACSIIVDVAFCCECCVDGPCNTSRASTCTNLRVKRAPWVAQVLCIAQNEAREDLLLLYAFQSQLEIFTWLCVVRLHVIREQTQHFHHMLHI